MREERKFRLSDVVYSIKNPVRSYCQRKLTYTITQVCEDCYEALSDDGDYLNIPFSDESIWERDVVVSGYNREGEYITTEDVKIEDFSFQYIPEDELDRIDIGYRLQLGDKFMESCISEWSVDYEEIRHDLEHLIFHGQTEIRLNFEDSPTIIRLERTFVQDREKFKEFGTYHGWTYLMRIEVYPDDFVAKKYPPIFGYARYVEAIQSLYYGLLNATKAYPEVNEENPDKNRKDMLEQLRSTKLEEYIRNCQYTERSRMTDYYRIQINLFLHNRSDYLLSEYQNKYIQEIAEKAAEEFLNERQLEKKVSEANNSAFSIIRFELDRYRIEL